MGNPIRFTGLSSGLDTESIVKAIMTPYQRKIDVLNKTKIIAEWKKEAYKEMSNKIQDFRNNAVAKIKTASDLNKSQVKVSQEGFINVDKSAYKEDGTHRIEVEQLATIATVETTAIKKSTGDKYTKEDKVSDIMGGAGSFNIEGIDITYDDSTTIGELEEKVTQGLKDAGKDHINFKYDEGAGGFLIDTKESGEKQEITITSTNGDLSKLGIKEGTYKGKDAKIKYNGGLTITSETNNIEVNGIKFEAVAETTAPITVTVSKDVDKLVETITDFVEEYNKLLEAMDKKYSADSAKGYEPLTEEEKAAMTDKDIELWENKIKDSLLSRDSSLGGLYNSLRGIMNANYSGEEGISDEYSMMAKIGIDSGSWKDKGKLKIDEDALRKAIANDSDSVVNLVSKIGSNMETKLIELAKSSDLKSYEQYFNDILETNKIRKADDDLIVAKARYDKLENMYYAKFTAMEQAMQKMNSQSGLFGMM